MGSRGFLILGGGLLVLSQVLTWLFFIASGTQYPPAIYPYWVAELTAWIIPMAVAAGSMFLGVGLILGGISRVRWSRRSAVAGIALLMVHVALTPLAGTGFASVRLVAEAPQWLVAAGRSVSALALACGMTLFAVGLVVARLARASHSRSGPLV